MRGDRAESWKDYWRARAEVGLSDGSVDGSGMAELDVERLAKAIRKVTETPYSLGKEADEEMDEADWLANAYAAEYRSLGVKP